jgi:cation:H+ antiporter
MGADMAIGEFAVAAVISLGTSWLLVTRLERLGERLGFSEALLGLLAALAADAPEITSAVTALVRHQRAVGSGVVIGSNVFNLAALLGLGAVVAGRIGLHRKVVALGGAVALWTALVCVVSVVGLLPAAAALALVLVVLVPYIVLLGLRHSAVTGLRLPSRWSAWLLSALVEEESELTAAIRPRPGQWPDAVVAGAGLLLIVASSIVMERAASTVGGDHRIAGIVIGGLVLAAVTSLPNAVAGVYLATRGRGAAMLSTTLNSNTLNVVLGLLLPATVVGLAPPSGAETLIVVWYGALTVLTLVFAYVDRGLRRTTGWIIVAGYLGFVVCLLLVS